MPDEYPCVLLRHKNYYEAFCIDVLVSGHGSTPQDAARSLEKQYQALDQAGWLEDFRVINTEHEEDYYRLQSGEQPKHDKIIGTLVLRDGGEAVQIKMTEE